MSEVQAQRSIAISISGNKNTMVILDDKVPTAFTDGKDIIVITQRLIPPNLRIYPRLVLTLFDAQTIHEATHQVISEPVLEYYGAWSSAKRHRAVAKAIMNIIEDKRVNSKITLHDPYHYAPRFAVLCKVIAESALPFPANKFSKFERVINGVIQKSLYGVLKVEKPTKEELALISEACGIVETAKYSRVPIQLANSVVSKYEELYALLEPLADQQSTKNLAQRIQNNIEMGELCNDGETSGDFEDAIAQESGDKPAPGKEGEEGKGKKKGEGDSDEKGKHKLSKLKGLAAGKGAGLDISAPSSDWGEYNRLVAQTRREQQRLLQLLKRIQTINWRRAPFERTGRFMTEVLGKAYSQSQTMPVRNIYQRTKLQTEQQKVAIGLLVDLSGSMELELAKRIMTILTEVCGQWLRDEDFTIISFGSDYHRIKVFAEAYHNTRGRIGGLWDMGGTEMYPPLQAMHKIFRTINGRRKKFCIVYSDFYTSHPEETQREIKSMIKDDINVIGIAPRGCEEIARIYTPSVAWINRFSDLPDAFFKVYMDVALRNPGRRSSFGG